MIRAHSAECFCYVAKPNYTPSRAIQADHPPVLRRAGIPDEKPVFNTLKLLIAETAGLTGGFHSYS